MQYSPPPLFKQGASARVKVIVFALMAIALLVVDSRMKSLSTIRQMVGAALFPLQTLAMAPRDAAYAVGDYFSSLRTLQQENSALKREQIANGQALQQGQQLLAENAQLRRLLAASERLPVKSVMSEILYDTRDAFSRKLVLDRGMRHGVVAGQPVIDDVGVVGQITRVFPFTSEVTLLTDKNHAISVQVTRSGVRSVAYGRGQAGVLDLRFIAANADIQKGDVLMTSGIDGVYPAGLAVARVTQVEHKSGDAFAGIVCQPTAGIDRHKQLLILLTEARPMSEATTPDAAADQKAVIKPGDNEPAAKLAPHPGKAAAASGGAAGIANKVPAPPAAAGQKAAPAAPATKPVPRIVASAPSAKPAPSASASPLKAVAVPNPATQITQGTPKPVASPVSPKALPKAAPTSAVPLQKVSAAPAAGRSLPAAAPTAGAATVATAATVTAAKPASILSPVLPMIRPLAAPVPQQTSVLAAKTPSGAPASSVPKVAPAALPSPSRGATAVTGAVAPVSSNVAPAGVAP